jgi:cob(I)alamin adenosyltransferase
MRIYTRTGDQGLSSLFDGERVKKYHLRLKTYGELDYLNVIIGWSRLKNTIPKIDSVLLKITNDIFIISSILATKDLSKLPENLKTIDENSTLDFEVLIDELTSEMPALTNFILPGGSELSLYFHEARVIARTAERYVVELADEEDIDKNLIIYINRLSDLFFTLARYANFALKVDEDVWVSC